MDREAPTDLLSEKMDELDPWTLPLDKTGDFPRKSIMSKKVSNCVVLSFSLDTTRKRNNAINSQIFYLPFYNEIL